ncbi:MAG: N-acetylmuramoyl-L-alanine amidase [Candidatus Marinimicrobia bacterium]|nr:N-acetylmuramoyl-L-alanine amidase [Candidatus Neomarinimicrobiota bacterium]
MLLNRILVMTLPAFLFWSCASKTVIIQSNQLEPIARDLEIITRADWGWVPLTDSIPTHEIKFITIHHGGEDFPEDKDPIKYLRGLQSWSQTDKNWIDNPYHYMIDLRGNIYEARPIRYPGDTNTDYDVRGHALICVMGNYENQILSPIQFEQLAKLTASLADRYDVSPDHIKSHRDYTETLCPGKDLYRYLEDGSLLLRIAALRN